MTLRVLVALGSLALALLLAPEAALAQCAMCKAAVTQSPEGREIAERLNTAILVMLFAPYLVFGTVATVLLVTGRRNESRSPRRPLRGGGR